MTLILLLALFFGVAPAHAACGKYFDRHNRKPTTVGRLADAMTAFRQSTSTPERLGLLDQMLADFGGSDFAARSARLYRRRIANTIAGLEPYLFDRDIALRWGVAYAIATFRRPGLASVEPIPSPKRATADVAREIEALLAHRPPTLRPRVDVLGRSGDAAGWDLKLEVRLGNELRLSSALDPIRFPLTFDPGPRLDLNVKDASGQIDQTFEIPTNFDGDRLEVNDVIDVRVPAARAHGGLTLFVNGTLGDRAIEAALLPGPVIFGAR